MFLKRKKKIKTRDNKGVHVRVLNVLISAYIPKTILGQFFFKYLFAQNTKRTKKDIISNMNIF